MTIKADKIRLISTKKQEIALSKTIGIALGIKRVEKTIQRR